MKKNKPKLEISYIAEFDLPSDRAYAVHVLKMLDNFSYFSNKVELIHFSKRKNYNLRNIREDFKLHSKNKLLIKSLFKRGKKNSSINRLYFGFLSALYLKDKNSMIITRSLFSSFFLSIFKKYHFLELHNQINGFSKIIFLYFGFLKSKYIQKVIFITKSLEKHYKYKFSKSIVLPDAAEQKDFLRPKKIKRKIKKILYIGSFYKGRGINIILNVAKKLTKYNFELIGNRDDIIKKDFKKFKNIKITNFIKYKFVSKKISQADLLLMPYSPNFVGINSKNLSSETSKFMSPLKMFEYLASGVPILSTEIKVLKEILIHKYNCIMIKKYNSHEWIKAIVNFEKNFILRKKISKNGLSTAKKYSWKNRVIKILKINRKY